MEACKANTVIVTTANANTVTARRDTVIAIEAKNKGRKKVHQAGSDG